MNAQEYKSELEKIAEKMPWREIAEAYIFGKEIEVNSWLDRVITEYKLLKTEIEGMEENPDAWVGDEDHPQTHINALKKLLGVYGLDEGGDVVRVEYESKIIPESIWFGQDSFSIAGKDEQGRAATIVIKYDETIEINGKAVIPSEINVYKDGFVIGGVTAQWGEEIEIRCRNPMAVAR